MPLHIYPRTHIPKFTNPRAHLQGHARMKKSNDRRTKEHSLLTIFISRRQLFAFAKIIHVGFAHGTQKVFMSYDIHQKSNITVPSAVGKYQRVEGVSICRKKCGGRHLWNQAFESIWCWFMVENIPAKPVMNSEIANTLFPHSSPHHSHRSRLLITLVEPKKNATNLICAYSEELFFRTDNTNRYWHSYSHSYS